MIDAHTLQISPSEAMGLTGAMIYSVSYLAAAYDRLPSQSPLYYASKLVAACLVLISLAQNFNLASAVIQIFFITVSLIGILRHLDARRRQRAYERSRHALGGTVTPSSASRRQGRTRFSEMTVPKSSAFRTSRLSDQPDR